jgi:lipopolysaccharide/colanic/teichoic acid biosynthesis glycosyltransferase
MLHSTSTYCDIVKPVIDRCVAAVLLVLCLPLLASLAIAVRIGLGSPVIFAQRRPGKHGQEFRLLKFRTMTSACGADGKLLPDDKRLTRFGRWLRATSLDELPELWNVLRGEMSLVGPRPLLTDYLPLYTPQERRRHDVLPGLTGWAQVNGRNGIGWARKFELDVEYVNRASLMFDLRIILQTLVCIVRRQGVTADDHATMPRFTGHSPAAIHSRAA